MRIRDWSSDVCFSDLGDIEVARGLHPDLAGGAGEEVVQGAVAGLAESLGEGDDRLAPAAELGDRGAQLLNLGDAGIAPAGPADEALHALVVPGGVQRLDHLDRKSTRLNSSH